MKLNYILSIAIACFLLLMLPTAPVTKEQNDDENDGPFDRGSEEENEGKAEENVRQQIMEKVNTQGTRDGSGADYPYSGNGNWVVDSVTFVWNETIILRGNLFVTDNGFLNFQNVTLIMDCTYDGEYNIYVNETGTFRIRDVDNDPLTTHDRSNITSSDPDYQYLFTVEEGATFEMQNSELHQCGWESGNYGLRIESDDASITHCYFSNNYYAISSANSEGLTIENCTFTDNFNGIRWTYTDDSRIANCTLLDHQSSGISLSNSDDNVIEGCTVVNASSLGISIYYSDRNRVSDCNVSECYYGFRIYWWADDNIISGCTGFDNAYGFFIEFACSGNEIFGNYASGNTIAGIHISPSGNSIHHNTIITTTGSWGIYFDGEVGYNNIVDDNTVNGCVYYHYYEVSGTHLSPIVIRDLTLEASRMSSTGNLFIGNCENISVINVTATNNSDGMGYAKGIYVWSSSNVTLENVHTAHCYYGMKVYRSTDVIISNSEAMDNVIGIGLSESEMCLLVNITISESIDKGISLESSHNNRINSCDISESEYGIRIYNSDDNEIITTDITGSDTYGIYLNTAVNTVVRDVMLNNCNIAIRISYCSDTTIVQLIATDGGTGVYLTGSQSTSIRRCTAKDNTFAGIYLSEAERTMIENSTFLQSGSPDLWVRDSSDVITVDSVFDTDNVQCEADCTVTVQNHLGIIVFDDHGDPLQNVDVHIEDNGVIVYSSAGFGGPDARTNAQGRTPLIAITDGIFDGSNLMTQNVTTVNITYQDLDFGSLPRDVDMAAQHLERFRQIPELTAYIDTITPNPALDTDIIDFTGHATGGNVILFVWESDIDGELYNGSQSQFTASNLTIGTHQISLTVMDDTGIWSEMVNDSLMVDCSTSYPDLAVTHVIIDGIPCKGEVTKILALVSNIGGAPTQANITYCANGSEIGTIYDIPFLPGYSKPVFMNWFPESGSNNITVMITGMDSYDPFLENNEKTLQVQVRQSPALIQPLPDRTFPEDQSLINSLDLNQYFSGQDLDFYVFDAHHVIVNILVNGSVHFSAEADWYGTEEIIIRACDPVCCSWVQDSMNVTVLPVNDAPIVANMDNLTYSENELIIISPIFDDPDDPVTDIEVNITSPFSRFGNTSAWFWIPDYLSSGAYIITATFSDGLATTNRTFTLTILDSPFQGAGNANDTDGDGFTDELEVEEGSDPLDSDDYPEIETDEGFIPGFTLVGLVLVLIMSMIIKDVRRRKWKRW